MAFRLQRPLALASVVTATLAGAVLLRACVSGGSQAPPPDASPSSESTATSTSPTATAVPVAPLTTSDPVLAKQTFPAGADVTARAGIGFLSSESGALETWSPTGGGSAFAPLNVSPDGALLFYEPAEGKRWVIERSSGKTWAFAASIHPVAEAAHGSLFLAEATTDSRPSILLLNAADGSARATDITLASSGSLFRAFISPDGREAAVLANGELSLLDLATLNRTSLARGLQTSGQPDDMVQLPAALGVALVRSGEVNSERRWFSWDGADMGTLQAGALSPNGRYLAARQDLGAIKGGGEGGYPAAGALVVVERGPNRPLLQALGADPIASADMAWSSASDALVIQVKDGYRLVGLDGTVLATIPDDIHVLNPRPSPTIKGLLATDRGTIINVARGTTLAPKYADLIWRSWWSTKPGELIVELVTPGKGRGWPVEVLPFELRTDRIGFPPGVRVNTPGDCLNLREKPSQSAGLVECMADGLTGFLEPTDDPEPPAKPESPAPRYSGFRAPDGNVWLHLKLSDGKSGWALASQLGWAP